MLRGERYFTDTLSVSASLRKLATIERGPAVLSSSRSVDVAAVTYVDPRSSYVTCTGAPSIASSPYGGRERAWYPRVGLLRLTGSEETLPRQR
jgi:hypothetical protein